MNSKEKLIDIVNKLPDEILKDLLDYIKSHYNKQLEEKEINLDNYYDKIIGEDKDVLKRLSE